MDRMVAISELLLGATHADGAHTGEEEAALRKMLKQWLKADELPDEVEDCIANFAIAKFDLARAAASFKDDSKADKRRLLELVAAVRDADGEVDLDEDAYLRKVAGALGVAEADFGDLTLDMEVDMSDLSANLNALRKAPPPPPTPKSR